MAVKRSPIFAVTSAKGGVGKSVFAANMAIALHQETNGSVLLLDMNANYCGDVSHAAGLSPFGGTASSTKGSQSRGIIDLMRNIHAITPRILVASVTPVYKGLNHIESQGERGRGSSCAH